MSTFSIGKWGLDITIPDTPAVYATDNGRTLTWSGEFVGTSLAQSQASQQQFLSIFGGDEGPPEPVVGVVWSDDDVQTAWMVPVSGTVEHKVLSLQDFSWHWTATLKRLPAAQAATHTARSYGTERTGAGGVSEDYWLGLPSGVKWVSVSLGSAALYYNRIGPSGSGRFYVDPGLANGVSTYRIDPADAYSMRPFVKVNGYEQWGPDVQAIGNGDDWEIGNGYIHFRGAAANTYTFRFRGPQGATAPGTGSSNWGTDYTFIAGAYLGGVRKILRPDHVEILSVDPERAGIKLTGGISTTGTNDNYRISLYIWVRRLSAYGECCIETDLSCQASLKDLAANSLTVITANKTLRSTSNDGNHNRLWIASGTTLNTGSAATGEVYANASGTQLPFGLGIENDGTAAVTQDQVANALDNYWADQSVVLEIG